MKYSRDEFAPIAQEYCSWVQGDAFGPEDEVKRAIILIASLYSCALAILEDGCGEDVEAQEVTHEEWQSTYNRFKSLPFNYYSVSFCPANIEEKPVTGDLADDLADIYRDIKNGLWLHENGYITEALWEWRQSFRTHWGRHAVSALHALHCYAADEYMEL